MKVINFTHISNTSQIFADLFLNTLLEAIVSLAGQLACCDATVSSRADVRVYFPSLLCKDGTLLYECKAVNVML